MKTASTYTIAILAAGVIVSCCIFSTELPIASNDTFRVLSLILASAIMILFMLRKRRMTGLHG